MADEVFGALNLTSTFTKKIELVSSLIRVVHLKSKLDIDEDEGEGEEEDE